MRGSDGEEDVDEDRYSFLVIHKLLAGLGVEYSESTVRRYIHRHFPKAVRPVMRRETRPGEVMEVDFGHLGLTWDTATRSRRRTWMFSGRLRHSRLAYREELEQYLNLTSEGLVQWAQRLGPSVGLVAELILADRAVDGLRPVRALIRLADTYTTARLEAACRRAVRFATPTCSTPSPNACSRRWPRGGAIPQTFLRRSAR